MIEFSASGFSTYPSGQNVLLSSAQWVQATLLGTFATAVAVIAVASIGFLMLNGRVNIRRGITVILGCFILFGAASIANGLRGAAVGVTEQVDTAPPHRVVVEPTLVVPAAVPAAEDPYAGASLRR